MLADNSESKDSLGGGGNNKRKDKKVRRNPPLRLLSRGTEKDKHLGSLIFTVYQFYSCCAN